MTVERPDEPNANQRTERPGSEMEELQLMPGGKAHRLQRGVAGRKQRQVWDVAIAEQPPAQLGVVLDMGAMPAELCIHASATQHRHRLADIAQRCRRCGEATIGMLCGADAIVDRVQPSETRQIGIDYGCGQARHRARTADDQHVARLGLGVDAVDRRDEIARVGKIDIMAALRDAGPGYPMILRLEGAARVNDDIWRDSRERLGQVTVDVDRMGFGRVDGPDRSDESLRLRSGAAANLQPDLGIACEAARDIAAEITVAADDQYARYHARLATMSQNPNDQTPATRP